ncbi:glycosyltransferase [Phycisphaera mikurensis]|uniref:glycosyltransferase n=1 Tax=Phycisphaera mikurensis TaxID=547188 RepID=UPI001E3E5E6C|nr:glycosyltransferase [Phycisphaera mikurensis]
MDNQQPGRFGGRRGRLTLRIVVVIPALNEAETLGALLARITRGAGAVAAADVFVSDSGSTDATTARAAVAGCVVIRGACVTGRGSALRAGVDAALAAAPDAGAVWMLHADCLPPEDGAACIRGALADPAVVGGAFGQRFNTSGCGRWARHRLRLVVFFNRVRYGLTGVYFGDQGIFVRPGILAAAGGVPPLDLFEDVELCRRLRAAGKLVLLPGRMTTSPRRFLANGPIRQLVRDAWMLLRHRLRGDGPAYAEAYARRRG